MFAVLSFIIVEVEIFIHNLHHYLSFSLPLALPLALQGLVFEQEYKTQQALLLTVCLLLLNLQHKDEDKDYNKISILFKL